MTDAELIVRIQQALGTDEVGANLIHVAQQAHDAELRTITLEADLEECHEFIENYSDVVDGDYGHPAPNRAMRLCTMIKETLYGPGA